jgi:hypothetical protein
MCARATLSVLQCLGEQLAVAMEKRTGGSGSGGSGLSDLSIQISNLRKCRDGLIPYSTESLRQAKQSILNPILPTSPGSEPRLARSVSLLSPSLSVHLWYSLLEKERKQKRFPLHQKMRRETLISRGIQSHPQLRSIDSPVVTEH